LAHVLKTGAMPVSRERHGTSSGPSKTTKLPFCYLGSNHTDLELRRSNTCDWFNSRPQRANRYASARKRLPPTPKSSMLLSGSFVLGSSAAAREQVDLPRRPSPAGRPAGVEQGSERVEYRSPDRYVRDTTTISTPTLDPQSPRHPWTTLKRNWCCMWPRVAPMAQRSVPISASAPSRPPWGDICDPKRADHERHAA